MNKGKKNYYNGNYYKNDYGYEKKRDDKNNCQFNADMDYYEHYEISKRKNTYNTNYEYGNSQKKSVYEDYNQIKYHPIGKLNKAFSNASPISKCDTKKTSNDSSSSNVITQDNSFHNDSPSKEHEHSSLCFINCCKFQLILNKSDNIFPNNKTADVSIIYIRNMIVNVYSQNQHYLSG